MWLLGWHGMKEYEYEMPIILLMPDIKLAGVVEPSMCW